VTPAAERELFDLAVGELHAEGKSQRAIATELHAERDKVRRALGRLARKSAQASAPAPAPLARVEPEPAGPAIGETLLMIEEQVARATDVGDAQGAGRWARARQALLAGQREAARAKAEAQTTAQTTEDWTRLNDHEARLAHALARKLNGEPLTRDNEVVLASLAPPIPAKACALCYAEHVPHEWTCPACAEIARRLRAGLPPVKLGEQFRGALPGLTDGTPG
jgi:hypothetical protein